MYALRVSKDIGPEPTKPIVLIDAGIHAREWVSISTIMYIINQVKLKLILSLTPFSLDFLD